MNYVKVTAKFTFEEHSETVTLDFLPNATQDEIEGEISKDFWEWAQQFDYGWTITKQERK